MEPVIVGADVYAELKIAVEPRAGEVVAAKQAVVIHLIDASATAHDLLTTIVADLGLPPAADRSELYDVPPDVPADEAVDAEAAPIRRVRLTQAVRLALAELASEGVVVPAESPGNDYLSVPVRRSGHSGSERIPTSTPALSAAYRLSRAHAAEEAPILTAEGYLMGLGRLLDIRARRCLEEALVAARRGLYLSAVNLLGAVSEAAWYSIGEALREEDAQLAQALDDNRTAQVQRLAAALLERVPRQRTTVSELRAHAAYLRDLRNYGVHPNEDPDPSQEHAFTELGCLLILAQTHRYLVRLVEAATAAGANLREI